MQQKGREQQIEPTQGFQGTQILVTVPQTPSGDLCMGHWRCFTFKSPQLPCITPRTPYATHPHLKTGSLSVLPAAVRMNFCSWLASTPTSASLTTLKPLTVLITTNYGKFLKMGIPEHLTYLLQSLYVGQEATVRTRCGTIDCFKIGKGEHKGCKMSPCLCNICRVYQVKYRAG